MDYKEYTRMRDIAQKRIKRAQAAGVPLYIHVPTVKELKQRGEQAQDIEFTRLKQFLSTGFSLERRSKSERRKRQVAKKYERPSYPKKYQGYVKGLKKLGVDIPPSKLPAFFAYMDYRFSQGAAEKKYVFDIFVDDYQTMLQKGYNPSQIISDFEKFEADQAGLSSRADDMTGMNYKKAIGLWKSFKDKFKR